MQYLNTMMVRINIFIQMELLFIEEYILNRNKGRNFNKNGENMI